MINDIVTSDMFNTVSEKVIITHLPRKNGTQYKLKAEDLERWYTSYTDIEDIGFEFVMMKNWLMDNPKKGKTDIKKFVNNWLQRASRDARKQAKQSGNTKVQSTFDRLTDRSWADGI